MNDEIEISVEDVNLPTRSAFANLEPIGRGTGEVESLWSYMFRLAAAHGITLFELLARLSPELFTGTHAEKSKVKVYLYQSYCSSRLNGSFSARRFLAKIEGRLPVVDGLEALSYIPLDEAVSDSWGLRRWRVWCAQCYRSDPTPYDRLAWSWKIVKACDHHNAVLDEACPACGARQRFRGTATDLTTCERCAVSLIGDAPSRPDAYERHLFRVASQMIQSGQRRTLTRESLEFFWKNVYEASQLAGGLTAFSALIGYARITLYTAYHGRRLISADLAARVTWITGVGIGALLSERLQFTHLAEPLPSWRAPRRPVRPGVPYDSDAVLLRLIMWMRDYPYEPLQAYELAKLCKTSPKHPSFQFPMVRELLRVHRRMAVRTQWALDTWRLCSYLRETIARLESLGIPVNISQIGRTIPNCGVLRCEGARRIRDGFIRAIRAGYRDVLIARTPPWYLQAAAKRSK